MKKILALCMAVWSFCAVGAFASCNRQDSMVSDATVIKNDTSTFAFKAADSADGSASVYDYLAAFVEENTLQMEGYESEYGYYITSVNGVSESFSEDKSHGSYWAVYTSVTTVDGVTYATSEFGTYDLNGQTLSSASYGVGALPVFGGETYALVYTSY